MDKRAAYIALNAQMGMIPRVFWRALQRSHDPVRIFSGSEDELTTFGFSIEMARRIRECDPEKTVRTEEEKILHAGGRIVTWEDADYPPSLKEISDAPPVLYIAGKIKKSDRIALAVVGSRSATTQGRLNAEKIASRLAGLGMTIVSGLAMGVDAWAHQGALKAGGRTLAVLGCGLDYPYPRINRELKGEIAKQGALISEFPMGTPPVPYNFPRRNRIISGLALGTLVVEATKKSGSLITAKFALEQGREVFAIPGSIRAPQSEGVNLLIQKGAKLVQTMEDILVEFPAEVCEYLKVSGREPQSFKQEVVKEESLLLQLIQDEPVHIDVLAGKTPYSAARISSLLMKMELKGLVRQHPGKLFTRR
ncbi:MAG: DNA-protecting protein DprA [Deltaproteobacteria bacterium]|nr:DNA-protecting protein DprA [Deltaproteobacteria bacterium]